MFQWTTVMFLWLISISFIFLLFGILERNNYPNLIFFNMTMLCLLIFTVLFVGKKYYPSMIIGGTISGIFYIFLYHDYFSNLLL